MPLLNLLPCPERLNGPSIFLVAVLTVSAEFALAGFPESQHHLLINFSAFVLAAAFSSSDASAFSSN